MKTNFTSRRFSKIGKTALTTMVALITLFFQCTVFAQTAPVNPPTGGFAIDGNLRANTSIGDWFPGSGSGGSVFHEDGTPYNSSTSGRRVDNFSSNDDVFTNGSKFNDYVSNLKWFSNSAPDKNDINVALYHVSRDASNNQWIFISGDRLSTNGTSYIDFELLQGSITQNTDGTFTGTPNPNKANGGGRTKDDIIISMEYTNGGTKPNVYIYKWGQSGNTWSYQQITPSNDLANNAFAETNRTGAITNLPYSAFGSSTYQQYAFVEAGVNVTYLLNLAGQLCEGLNIQTLWVKTKASASSTAALKDFISPIPVNFEFGTPSSTNAAGPYVMCASDGSVNVSGTYNGSATGATWSTLGSGVFSNISTNTVTKTVTATYTPSTADKTAGSVTLKLTPTGDASCSAKPSTATLTIKPNPVAPTVTPTNNCDGTSILTASNYTGSLLWSTGATTSSIQVTNNNTYTVVQTVNGCASPSGSGNATIKTTPPAPGVSVQNNCDGSSDLTASGFTGALLWSNGATASSIHVTTAGTYTVTQTVNGCISPQGSGVAAPKTTPNAPAVSMVTPTCTDKTFSLQVNSPALGTTYTLTQPGNVNPPQVIDHTAAGDVIFTGLSFGDGYSVTAANDNGGCVSDPNSCGSPTPQSRLSSPTGIQNQPITLDKPVTDVKAFPNPYNNVVRFSLQSDVSGQGTLELYNLLGQKVKTVYQGFVPKGFKQTIDYAVPAGIHTNLIYLFRVGNERKSGILIGAK